MVIFPVQRVWFFYCPGGGQDVMALPGCISVPTWNTVDAEDADEMTESFYLVLLPSVHSVSY